MLQAVDPPWLATVRAVPTQVSRHVEVSFGSGVRAPRRRLPSREADCRSLGLGSIEARRKALSNSAEMFARRTLLAARSVRTCSAMSLLNQIDSVLGIE